MRQVVSHGHIVVDGRRATTPSMRLRDGQAVGLLAGAPSPRSSGGRRHRRPRPGWLQADHDKLEGKVLRSPRGDEITTPVTIQLLVVERYARLVAAPGIPHGWVLGPRHQGRLIQASDLGEVLRRG